MAATFFSPSLYMRVMWSEMLCSDVALEFHRRREQSGLDGEVGGRHVDALHQLEAAELDAQKNKNKQSKQQTASTRNDERIIRRVASSPSGPRSRIPALQPSATASACARSDLLSDGRLLHELEQPVLDARVGHLLGQRGALDSLSGAECLERVRVGVDDGDEKVLLRVSVDEHVGQLRRALVHALDVLRTHVLALRKLEHLRTEKGKMKKKITTTTMIRDEMR